MEMPTINIPPAVRFALYVLATLASLFVAYAVDKDWAGDAEVRLVSGLVAFITLLAAVKTNLKSGQVLEVQGHVEPATGMMQGTISPETPDAPLTDLDHDERGERGDVPWNTVLAVALIVLVVIVIVWVVGEWVDDPGPNR